jgi:hypothetical protein
MAKTQSGSDRVLPIQKGTYSDGHPLDEIHYLECKIILKPERFTSVQSFHEFGRLVRHTADELSIGFSTHGVAGQRPQIREVLFFDTADFRLYNNAFILRRRILYEDGFPIGEPEIVFKFRHPDIQEAAELDVRPNIAGEYKIKFKSEALPMRDRIGGFRRLFSHNVEFELSQVHEGDRGAMTTLSRVFPALAALKQADTDRIELVNETIVEEVLQDLGELDFGKGVTAETNVALWRQRGDHMPLVGEFSFQCKFQRRDELHDKALSLCEQFFVSLQHRAEDWVSLGTTKTGAVYRLKGNPPQAHE